MWKKCPDDGLFTLARDLHSSLIIQAFIILPLSSFPRSEIPVAVSAAALEQTLRDLPKVGTLVKDRPYRQVWRFDAGGKGYYLKFYPRLGSRLKRIVRGNPAMREFVRL